MPIPARTPSSGRRRANIGAALLVLSGLLGLSFAVATTGADAAAPAPTTEANAALDWLAAQLGANGGTMPGFVPGSPEWGLTADAVLAFATAGRGADAAPQTAADLLADNLVTYTTWDPDVPGVRVAGATAKVLLTLQAVGHDTSNLGGVDLEAELRSLMLTTGAQTGRFVDRVPDPTWDSSNGFGQALSILALSSTTAGVPTEATTFLLAQQCPNGGFRLTYVDTPCTTDSSADTDTTALAVQALLSIERTTAVDAALVRAVQWLLSVQDVATGGFGGTGPTAAINSNSTGVIAQTLRAAGQTTAADRAAAWITGSLQLNAANSTGTPAAAEVGAVAYDPAGRVDALTNGIDTNTADQWRRSTTQAVLALGLSPYGLDRDVPVVLPTPSTTTTTTTSSTSTTTTVVPTEPTIPVAAQSTVDPDAAAAQAAEAAAAEATRAANAASQGATNPGNPLGTTRGSMSAGRSSSANAASTRSALAATGDDPSPYIWLSLGLLFGGALLAGTGRRLRHPSRPGNS